MGSFYSTCSISSMTLTNEPTSIILLTRARCEDLDSCRSMIVSKLYSPFSFPIHGRYDDYGEICDIKRDKNVEMMEEYFGLDINSILDNVGRDRDIPENIKNVDVYKRLSLTYIRTEVLQYLERGWEKLDNPNPEKYTISEYLNKFFDILKKKESLATSNEYSIPEELIKNNTDEQKDILRYYIFGISKYDLEQHSPISSVEHNMYSTLPITTQFKEDILKQRQFLYSLESINKILMPSVYGSQYENWTELYLFNDFVNDILHDNNKKRIEDIKSYGDEPSGDLIELISTHQISKRNKKLNQLID